MEIRAVKKPSIKTVVWGIITGLALIFGSLRDAASFFLSLFVGEAHIDDVTRIQITIIVLGVASLAILIWHTLKVQSIGKKDGTDSQKPPDRIIHSAYPPTKPDLAYEHLHAHLFWESWRYFPLAKRLGAKNGRKHLSSTKMIVNLHTRKAYQISSYIGSLILSGKIQYHDRRKTFPTTELGGWAEKHGYTFIDRFPSEAELQPINLNEKEQSERLDEKEARSEHSVGTLSVPFFNGFELTQDKLTYKVGDTIRASVRVVSLTPGATTVRLISPSEEQLAIKSTTFHLSGTFNFELAVVEQSWERGVWKIIARQGTMLAEQEIKIN